LVPPESKLLKMLSCHYRQIASVREPAIPSAENLSSPAGAALGFNPVQFTADFFYLTGHVQLPMPGQGLHDHEAEFIGQQSKEMCQELRLLIAEGKKVAYEPGIDSVVVVLAIASVTDQTRHTEQRQIVADSGLRSVQKIAQGCHMQVPVLGQGLQDHQAGCIGKQSEELSWAGFHGYGRTNPGLCRFVF
jgi:hypothetical protein